MFNKILGFLMFSILVPCSAFASGGINMITGGDANGFVPTPIENGYSLTGQGVTVTIVNGVATITKGNDTVVVGDTVDITGDIETRKLGGSVTGAIDSGIAASGGINMLTAPTVPAATAVTNSPVEIKKFNFSDTFFKKFGIE